ncbi:BPSL0761 family protein [Noviherbaspirillum soli]|uniref:BPSL0761 family protein n=1 Tax=Noviherbaspirillum soli TaxID=1064518 RepID=UPI002B276610|nr:BPSL0761 family protein [Noviherbaspirillum soli]
MTTPFERTRAVLKTREFLCALAHHPTRTPGVPEAVRQQAVTLLRHYPGTGDMSLAHGAIPNWFGPPDG